MKNFKMFLVVAIVLTLIMLLPIFTFAEDWFADDYVTGPGGLIPETHTLAPAATAFADNTVLPDYLNLSQDKYFPPIRAQGSIGSCSAWSTVYYQFTYQVARMNNWDAKNNDDHVFSPRYIYNYLNGGQNRGLSQEEPLWLLKEIGSVRFSEFPSTGNRGDALNPAEYQGWYDDVEDRLTAMKTVVSSYSFSRLGSVQEQTPVSGPKDSSLNHIKELLNSGHLITFAAEYSGGLHVSKLSDGRWAFDILRCGSTGKTAHQFTIVGYDDNAWYDLDGDGEIDEYEKGAFIVANSWGTTFLDDGFVLLLYDALNPVSNCARYNMENRVPFFYGMEYCYIEVANREIDLYAEVTVNQRYRDQVQLSFSKGENGAALQTQFTKLVTSKGGEQSYDGINATAQDYVYLVNFSRCCDVDFRGPGDIFVTVTDCKEGSDTQIKSVIWKDRNGNKLKQLTPETTIVSAGTEKLGADWVPVTGITLSKNTGTIFADNWEILSPTISPANATYTDLIWTSSNPASVTVDSSGTIHCVGTGTAVITVTTADGKYTASCIYHDMDDHSNSSAGSTPLKINQPVNGEISYEGDVDCFFFGFEEGEYLLYVEGLENAVITLRFWFGEAIETAECISEDGHIYRLRFSCEAVQVRLISVEVTGGTGSYMIYIVPVETA